MIFVTLGTQKQQFTRLLDALDDCTLLKDEDIIIQRGYTEYNGKFKNYDFLSQDEFKECIKKSDFVITHGGVGSIINILNEGKKLIAVPRLKKFNEHVNDHQIEICDKFSELGYIIKYNFEEALEEKIKYLKTCNLNKYINENNCINNIKNIIDTI